MRKDKKRISPIIKDKLARGQHLSMDEYLEFVLFNLRHNVDIEAVRKQRKAQAVNVPFVLK